MEPIQEELETLVFDAIWRTIKRWDICREPSMGRNLYAGATGTDVKAILDSIKPFLKH